jgi:hypothetical protein
MENKDNNDFINRHCVVYNKLIVIGEKHEE